MVSNCLHDQQTEQSAAMTEELSCSDLVLRFFRSSAGVKAPYKSHLSDVRRRYRLPLKSQLHWQSTVGLLTCSWICCHVRMMFLPNFFSCYVFLMYVLCVLDFLVLWVHNQFTFFLLKCLWFVLAFSSFFVTSVLAVLLYFCRSCVFIKIFLFKASYLCLYLWNPCSVRIHSGQRTGVNTQ